MSNCPQIQKDAPNNTELGTANDQPFNSRDTYKAHTHTSAHAHISLYNHRHPPSETQLSYFCALLQSGCAESESGGPCTNVMAADTVTPRRLTLPQQLLSDLLELELINSVYY